MDAFDGGRLVVAADETSRAAAVGDSVAVAGVCLTVVESSEGQLSFDVVPETLARTALGGLGPGSSVNLEPSLRVGDQLGGHVVQGHVDAVGRVRSVAPEGAGRRVWIDAPETVVRLVHRERLDRGRRRLPHGRRLRRRGLRGRADPAYARRHDPRPARARRRGQPRGRRAREGRGAPRRGEAAVSSAVTPFASIEEAVEDIRNGKMVVVVDDPERENEGDLVCAAQFATPEAVNFMATHARGLICLCLTGRALRAARPAADDRAQRGASRHRVHRLGRGPRRRDDGHLGGRPRRTRSTSRSIRSRRRTTSSSPATSSRCARATAACSCAPARRRRPSISRGSPASIRPASCARS